MPTIEIISFGRQTPIKIQRSRYNFAIRQNLKLVSHRGLFQVYLDENNGVILHIGDLELAKECFFFAGELIDWDFEDGDVAIPMIDPSKPDEEQCDGSGQMDRFKFQQEFVSGINDLMKKSLGLSPMKKCSFLTDVQFGPESPRFMQLNNIEEFWNIHHSKGLAWNTMYIIYNG